MMIVTWGGRNGNDSLLFDQLHEQEADSAGALFWLPGFLLCGCHGSFHHVHLAFANCLQPSLEVASCLVGIIDGEVHQRLIEALGGPKVSRQHARVAGARVSFGEQFAAHFGILRQPLAFEVAAFDAGLVVAQLAHEVRPVL